MDLFLLQEDYKTKTDYCNNHEKTVCLLLYSWKSHLHDMIFER
jgi:hypothetical protein